MTINISDKTDDKYDKRSPLAIARDEWFESDDGVVALSTNILLRPHDAKYLRNRLETAFLAGAKAQEKISER